MNTPEVDICAIAVKYLHESGWQVASEAPICYRPIDVIAVRTNTDETLAMEAKAGFCYKLRQQLKSILPVADYAIAVVGRRPSKPSIQWCTAHGVGVWLARENTIVIIMEPVRQTPSNTLKGQLIEIVMSRRNHDDSDVIFGGQPCMKSVGVAQEVQRRVDAYIAKHPDATWKEIHANVPSHYATPANMYSALRSNQERLAIRARRKISRTNTK